MVIEDGIALFTDEDAPQTVDAFLKRLSEVGSYGGDFIVFVLGDSSISEQLLEALRGQTPEFFQGYGIANPEEFLADEFRA